LDCSRITSGDDIIPLITFVEPRQALGILHDIPGFKTAQFSDFIKGFISRIGWPWSGDNELGLSSAVEEEGFGNLEAVSINCSFCAKLLWQWITASDSIQGNQVRVSTFCFVQKLRPITQ
jgi:hypothetical protein